MYARIRSDSFSFLHLCNYQVCLGVVVTGRSSTLRLNRVMNKINAHTLAALLFPNFAYVRSDRRPEDPPPRRFENATNRATPRRTRQAHERPLWAFERR